MTNTYDTSQYPLGSTEVKVLFNNASNLDDAVNGAPTTWIDRFGVRRKSWKGIETDFTQFIISSGYEFVGDYDADGPLTLTRANQIFSKDGEFWSPGPALSLPYTTVNNWVIDQPKFISRGDAVIRQDLASPSPLLGVSLVNGAARIVDSVAALAALPAAGSKYATILGYASAGDGAPMITYRQNNASVATPNGGSVIALVGGGNWEAVNIQDMNVMSFGAVPGASNSSIPFQAAIDALGIARVPFHVSGFTASGLTIGSNQKIIGESKVKIFTLAAAYCGVRVVPFGIGTYAFIENVLFDCVNSPTSCPAIMAGTATGVVFGLRVKNVDFMNCGAAYAEEVHATNYIVDAYFSDCVCYFSRGLQFFSRRSRGFFTLRDFKVDHTYNPGQVTWGGIRLDDFIGVELEKVDVVGPVQPAAIYQSGAIGLQCNGVLGSASVWMRRVLVDNTRGPGIGISNCHNVFGVDTCVFQNLGPAIDLTNVSKSQFVNTKVVGGIGLAGAAANANGITMNGCSNVNFNGHAVESNTGNGVVMNGCTDCSTVDGYSDGNTGVGYLEVTAASRNLRSNVRAISNGSGSVTQIGAQSATMSYWPNSGTFVAQTAGPATII